MLSCHMPYGAVWMMGISTEPSGEGPYIHIPVNALGGVVGRRRGFSVTAKAIF